MKMVTTRGVFKKTTIITAAFVLAISTVAAMVPFILSQKISAVSTPYAQSFETTSDWTNSSIVSDGADGFNSTDGTHYARISSGAFTRWGGYESVFPENGYSTSIDLFLYMNTATGNGADLRVDYSSAINNQSGTHLRDFIFHLGTDPTTANQWLVNASNNSPGNPSATNNLAITEDGWYTLKHDFKNNNGVLEVTLSVIKKSNGEVLKSWVLSSPSDLISSVVGGNRYGWFTGNRFDIPYVAIDNAKRTVNDPTAAPAAPSNLRLNGDQACGYTTNVNYITPTWDAVDGAISYNYQVTVPSGAVYGPVNVGNVTSVSGAFGGEGLSTFSVQAVGANGLTSAWAPACAVTYDATAPETPVHVSPSQNAVINFNDFYFDWTDASGAVRYEMQNSTNPAVDDNGSFQNVMWTGDYQQIQPTESKARSVGASGTWYWQVRAVDAAGNKSAWTTPWAVTIDMVAPAAPVLTARTPGGTAMQNGGSTNSYEVVADWNDVDGASSYIYKYWNSIAGNPYTSANPYTVDGLGASQTAGVFNQGEGTHFMQVFAVDAAGNVSQGSNVFEITYDTTAPLVLGDTYSTQDNVITPNFSVDDPSATLVWQQVSGPDGGAVPSNTSVVAPNFTVNTDGEYSFQLTATDGAGNQVNKLFTFNFVTPPAQTPVTSPEVLGTDTEADGPTIPVVPAVTTFAATPTIVGPGFTNVAVLGGDEATQNIATQEDSEVEGASTLNSPAQAVNSDANQGNFLGLAWYWWLLILAAITGIAWWIIAAIRNRQAQN